MQRGIDTVASSVRSSLSRKELTDAFTYCVQVVRVRDFENYVWCTQLPKALRPGIFALRAFHVETASVVERAGQGNLFSQMRFQWWLDAVSSLYKNQPTANPIFRALSHVLQTHDLTRYRLRKIVETRQSDALREKPFETLTELEKYAEGTASQLLQLQLEAVDVGMEDNAAYEAAQLIGKAVGLTNVLRGTKHHARSGKLYFPKPLLEQFKVEPEAVLACESNDAVRQMTSSLVDRAQAFLKEARSLRGQVTSRAAPSVLLPATVAETYLNALRRHRSDLFDPALQKHTDGYMLLKLQLLIKFRALRGRY